ncbi:T-lymphocyte activation antigen CD80 isoform X1 [Pleurodeles waltl]|uniref:T-lymphocyte activation antigen CD80 isoform X1 n=1 Tax=Pleurodeles waltl TaxID=8319 RepID=UPI0037095098
MPLCGTKAPSWRRTGSAPRLWIPQLALLCVTCFLPGICKVVSIQASLNSTVVLPCHHAIGPEELLRDYRVYWQMGHIVAHALMDGRHEEQHQNGKYFNRTCLDHNNLSLSLSDVRVSDAGSYSCYVQKRDGTGRGFKSIQADYSVLLSVIAAYSQPTVSQEEPSDNTCCVNLTCLSQGGYPQASVVWYNLTGEHVIPESQQTTSFLQDPDSHLYNVTSRLVVEASTCLVVCSVQSEHLPAANSSHFTPDGCKLVPEPKKKDASAIVVGIIAIILALLLLFLAIKFCCPCSTRRNNSPSYAAPIGQRGDNNNEDATL